jgi:hypothetical protein
MLTDTAGCSPPTPASTPAPASSRRSSRSTRRWRRPRAAPGRRGAAAAWPPSWPPPRSPPGRGCAPSSPPPTATASSRGGGGDAGVGTVVRPATQAPRRRKLWIAFAVGSSGTVVVDDGARAALIERNVSLLPAGVVAVRGAFAAGDAVEVAGPRRPPLRQGARPGERVGPGRRGRAAHGRPGRGHPHEVVHRDDLVVLPRAASGDGRRGAVRAAPWRPRPPFCRRDGVGVHHRARAGCFTV